MRIKDYIYDHLTMLIVILLFMCSVCHAQNESIPSSAVDAGVSLSQQTIDAYNAQIAQAQQDIVNHNNYIAIDQQKIAALQAQILTIQTNLTALASQNPPIQSALTLLNSNPSYGINWTITLNDNVNWDTVALLKLQSVDWKAITQSMPNINWTDVNIKDGLAGTNWATLSGVNWANWPVAESAGVNWYTFVTTD